MSNRTFTVAAALLAFASIPVEIAFAQQQQQQGAQQQQQQQQQRSGGLAVISVVASLTPAEIVGDSAAPAGSAKAALELTAATKEVCYNIETLGLTEVTEARIHKGVKGQNGPVAIPLEIRKDTTAWKGCVKPEEPVFAEISAAPADFYLQLYTARQPRGAIRGQLTIKPPTF